MNKKSRKPKGSTSLSKTRKSLTNSDIEERTLQRASEENTDILDDLSPAALNILEREFQTSIQKESFSGPLPHPRILKGYDDINKGFAERVLKMAEDEQRHRHHYDEEILKSTKSADKRGQWMGFSIAIVFGVAATWLGLTGNQVVASILGGLDIVSLVTVYVTNQYLNRNS